MSLLLFGTAFAPAAFAEARRADIIMGQTVESRGLSVAQIPNIDAAYAMVMDSDGTVYFERDAYDATKIASITKIMTAIVAVESVPLDTQITVSEEAAGIGESSAALVAGDTLTVNEALKALLIPSGNDAALALSEGIGALMLQSSGSDSSDLSACNQAFVDAMNAKGTSLGLTDTLFSNAHGLDDEQFTGDHHSTAGDVALIAKEAMSKQIIRDIVGTGDSSCTVTRDNASTVLKLDSTDELIGVYDGTCGIKTGYTNLAGYSFAGACVRQGKEMYAIVIGSSSSQQRFDDATNLWDWVYAHDIDYKLIDSPNTIADTSGTAVPLVADVGHSQWMDRVVHATVADPAATVRLFDLNGNITQTAEFDTLTGTIEAGDKVGTLIFKQHNEEIARVDLIACQDAPGPNILEMIGIAFNRFVGGFQGIPSTAESVLYNQISLINDKSV